MKKVPGDLKILFPEKAVILALGTIAHRAVLKAYGLKLHSAPFAHNAQHALSVGPVLVDSWAPWSGPCTQFAPTFTAAAQRYANQVVFAKVNTEAEQQLGSQFQIRSIPTLAVFKGGKELDRLSGALRPPELEQYVNTILRKWSV